MKSVTDTSNKTSAIPPLKHNGQICNKASDKAELLIKMFASHVQLEVRTRVRKNILNLNIRTLYEDVLRKPAWYPVLSK